MIVTSFIYKAIMVKKNNLGSNNINYFHVISISR